MTWDEALRRAHEAMGCRKVLIAKPQCDLHVQLWPCDQSRAVADLLLAVAREERAAALDEAADSLEALPPILPRHARLVGAGWLRERAQAIREGR